MKLYYDPNIGDRIPNGGSGRAPVFNGRFDPWRRDIIGNLSYVRNHSYEQCRGLLAACKSHIQEYSQPIDAEDVVLLTHPFYLSLCQMYALDSGSEGTIRDYLENLFTLLEAGKSRDRFNIVVFETAQHYGAITSLLLEAGLIDAVALTKSDSGSLLDLSDIRRLKDKTLFVGGGYNGRCLYNSMNCLRINGQDEKIFAISDLILNSPYDGPFSPREIIFGQSFFPPSRVLSLEKVLERFGVSSSQLVQDFR